MSTSSAQDVHISPISENANYLISLIGLNSDPSHSYTNGCGLAINNLVLMLFVIVRSSPVLIIRSLTLYIDFKGNQNNKGWIPKVYES